jgi:GntR family transcriptional repressor for pyruvate dehydrogenase complex
MILEDNLRPGDPLPSEAELIEQHQMSRSSVREALRLLEAEGFVAIRRGAKGGVVVQYPTVDLVSGSLATLITVAETPLRQLFEMRKLLEPAAADLVAREASTTQREQLLQFTDESGSNRRGTVDFHQMLAECTGNEFMRTMLGALNRVVGWHADLERIANDDEAVAGEAHAVIARAIGSGDGPRAAEATLKHIEAFEALMAGQGRLDEATLPRALWVRYLRQGLHGL